MKRALLSVNNFFLTTVPVAALFTIGVSSAMAAIPPTTPTFLDNVKSEIIQPLIYLLIAAAFGYFVFGVMLFVKDMDNEVEKENGKKHMIWGVIGLTVIFSVYGILNILAETVRGVAPY